MQGRVQGRLSCCNIIVGWHSHLVCACWRRPLSMGLLCSCLAGGSRTSGACWCRRLLLLLLHRGNHGGCSHQRTLKQRRSHINTAQPTIIAGEGWPDHSSTLSRLPDPRARGSTSRLRFFALSASLAAAAAARPSGVASIRAGRHCRRQVSSGGGGGRACVCGAGPAALRSWHCTASWWHPQSRQLQLCACWSPLTSAGWN